MDREAAEKLLAKRDHAWEQEVMDWVGQVLETRLPSEDVLECLKNGVVLCKLINKVSFSRSFFFFFF